MARDGRTPALRLEQDHHRRVSRGRVAKPGGARSSCGQRPGRRGRLAPPHGRLAAHRLMGDWQPTAAFWTELVTPDARDADVSRPYPFFLAYPLEGAIEELGGIREWQVEWKWDGIRAQLIRRSGRTFVWSRGEELMTDRFPELAALGAQLPEGLVVDGKVL